MIMGGMFLAFFILVRYISEYASFSQALDIASALEKTQAVDFDFNFEKRYTLWSGITGGLFLALSYFGTDQSPGAALLGRRGCQSK